MRMLPCQAATDCFKCRACYHVSMHDKDSTCAPATVGECPGCQLMEIEEMPEPIAIVKPKRGRPIGKGQALRVKKEKIPVELTVEENEQMLRRARLTHAYEKAKQERALAKRKRDEINKKTYLSRKASQK